MKGNITALWKKVYGLVEGIFTYGIVKGSKRPGRVKRLCEWEFAAK